MTYLSHLKPRCARALALKSKRALLAILPKSMQGPSLPCSLYKLSPALPYLEALIASQLPHSLHIGAKVFLSTLFMPFTTLAATSPSVGITYLRDSGRVRSNPKVRFSSVPPSVQKCIGFPPSGVCGVYACMHHSSREKIGPSLGFDVGGNSYHGERAIRLRVCG